MSLRHLHGDGDGDRDGDGGCFCRCCNLSFWGLAGTASASLVTQAGAMPSRRGSALGPPGSLWGQDGGRWLRVRLRSPRR